MMSIVGKRVSFAFSANRSTLATSFTAFSSFTTNSHNLESCLSSTSESTEQQSNKSEEMKKPAWIPNGSSPWARENLPPADSLSKLSKSRFRQHVNLQMWICTDLPYMQLMHQAFHPLRTLTPLRKQVMILLLFPGKSLCLLNDVRGGPIAFELLFLEAWLRNMVKSITSL